MKVITGPRVFAVIYWITFALQVISCATITDWPSIGNCPMPPDRAGAKLVGCIAEDAPDNWGNITCHYLTADGRLIAMHTEQCGDWHAARPMVREGHTL